MMAAICSRSAHVLSRRSYFGAFLAALFTNFARFNQMFYWTFVVPIRIDSLLIGLIVPLRYYSLYEICEPQGFCTEQGASDVHCYLPSCRMHLGDGAALCAWRVPSAVHGLNNIRCRLHTYVWNHCTQDLQGVSAYLCRSAGLWSNWALFLGTQ